MGGWWSSEPLFDWSPLPQDLWILILKQTTILVAIRSIRLLNHEFKSLVDLHGVMPDFSFLVLPENSHKYAGSSTQPPRRSKTECVRITQHGTFKIELPGQPTLVAYDGEEIFSFDPANANLVTYHNLSTNTIKTARLSKEVRASAICAKRGHCFLGCPSEIFEADFNRTGEIKFKLLFRTEEERKMIECFVSFKSFVVAVDNVVITKYGWVFQKNEDFSLTYKSAQQLGSGVYLRLVNAAASDQILAVGAYESTRSGRKDVLFLLTERNGDLTRNFKYTHPERVGEQGIHCLAVIGKTVFFGDGFQNLVIFRKELNVAEVVQKIAIGKIFDLRADGDFLFVFVEVKRFCFEVMLFLADRGLTFVRKWALDDGFPNYQVVHFLQKPWVATSLSSWL